MTTSSDNTINEVRDQLIAELEATDDPSQILKHEQLKNLYSQIPQLDPSERADFGRRVNELKVELENKVTEIQQQQKQAERTPIDVTAPMDVNSPRPMPLPAQQGTLHPVTQELEVVTDIFLKMGFDVVDSRLIDDDFHVFGSLNFPDDHPARDDYDTFTTTDGLIAPPHTSTMQHRVLKARKDELEAGNPISVVVPGRVFRNEDVDARHEHTFTQVEGIHVDKGVNVGNLIATLTTMLEAYYQKDLDTRITPFYFPFTEPSFEFSLSCPFCRDGCKVCSYEGWIELLGCGMIHPNVLEAAGIDSDTYSGFAWGFGVERLVMMKHDIEDVRHFHSGKLNFLEQF
jgi:phenylalanyl-tRNA synthetase alpha chain